MFAVFYGLFTLFEKIGWDIEYNRDKYHSKNIARQNNSDIYIDKKGKQRLVSNDQVVTTYRNMNGDVMRLDLNRDIVDIVSQPKDPVFIYKTVKKCVDKYGNPESITRLNIHKNFKPCGDLLQDIKTGQYLVIREIKLEDKWKRSHGKMVNKGRTHLFYMDPMTLKLIRETDGEIELRNRGYKNCPEKNEVDEFIKKYNYKLYNDYFEVKEHSGDRYFDLASKTIDEMIWKQNKKEEKANE